VAFFFSAPERANCFARGQDSKGQARGFATQTALGCAALAGLAPPNPW
jgi:hypothetical protein